MSDFTDRLIAIGVNPGIASDIEVDLYTELTRARAEKQRLVTAIDAKQAEIDGLKTQRRAQDATIDAIRATLGNPTA